jgi:hypothetical protein
MRLLVPQGQMNAVDVRFVPQGLICAIKVLQDRAQPGS